jgi:hypothetical protein
VTIGGWSVCIVFGLRVFAMAITPREYWPSLKE